MRNSQQLIIFILILLLQFKFILAMYIFFAHVLFDLAINHSFLCSIYINSEMFKKIVFMLLVLALIQSAIIQTNIASGGTGIVPPTISSVPIIAPPNNGSVNSLISPQTIPPPSNNAPTGTVGGQAQLTPVQVQNLMKDTFFIKVYNTVQQYIEQTYKTKLQRVLSLYAQMVSGTNYRFICTTQLGIAQIKVFTQPWTNTIKILSANITSATGTDIKPSL